LGVALAEASEIEGEGHYARLIPPLTRSNHAGTTFKLDNTESCESSQQQSAGGLALANTVCTHPGYFEALARCLA
jgi:hypothetical protein